MKFLVTGASGFMGYHMCNFILNKGHKVVGVDIAPFEYKDLNKVKFYKGDIRDRKFMKKIMKGVDVVVHCAAALPLWSKEDIITTNVGGTRNILELAVELKVPRVIYISSTSVYGLPETHPVTEKYPVVGVGPYGQSKIDAEKVCESFRNKLCVPVIRPKTFGGPLRLGAFQILCEWVRKGKNIPVIGNGKNLYQLLHVDDLMTAVYLASTKPANKANDTFNVGATKFKSLAGDLQDMIDYAGHGKKVVPIPSIFAIPILKLLEKMHVSPLYEWIYETADKDHYVSVKKIQRVLGWKPKKTTADVWIDTYKWYLKNWQKYEGKSGKSGVTHRVAWKQGALELVQKFF